MKSSILCNFVQYLRNILYKTAPLPPPQKKKKKKKRTVVFVKGKIKAYVVHLLVIKKGKQVNIYT